MTDNIGFGPQIKNLFNKRTVALVDGANFYAASKNLAISVDFKKLLKLLITNFDLDRAVYYTAIKDTIQGVDNNPIKRLVDYLTYNGWSVVTKRAKEYTTREGVVRTKGNMDLEIAINAMEMAEYARVIILFTGDGDFKILVEALQKKGVKVIVISTMRTSPPMVADELRKQADIFIDMADFGDEILRDPES